MTRTATSSRKRSAASTTQYRYDSDNRLAEVTLPDGRIVRYKYDPFGRRIEKDVAGQVTQFVYDGFDILMERMPAGLTLARYTHGPVIDEPLVIENASGVRFLSFRRSRQCSSLTNASERSSCFSYDSFGRPLRDRFRLRVHRA